MSVACPRRLPRVVPALLLVTVVGCAGSGGADDPVPGSTEFVSALAAEYGGVGTPVTGGGLLPPAGTLAPQLQGSLSPRDVTRGDVYRVLGPRRVLNLNRWRGLQVIDIDDRGVPRIVGGLPLQGEPVEMHVDGEFAWIVLAAHWDFARPADPGAAFADRAVGSQLVAVDLSDRRRPRIVDSVVVANFAVTSRLLRDGARRVLYVATVDEPEPGIPFGPGVVLPVPPSAVLAAPPTERRVTHVRSFSIRPTGEFVAKDVLELEGDEPVVQAADPALLVATRVDGVQTVAIVDISDPRGRVSVSLPVAVTGHVAKSDNLDLVDGVLRVASHAFDGGGSTGGGTRLNHIETFDVRDPQRPRPIDRASFGYGENLYATLFLDDKAFAVTYLRVDPFHAFSIDAAGRIEEQSAFIVSGWNDWFRAVGACDRLIGIGKDDQAGNTAAVSLYDITDLRNPQPLVARAHASLVNTFSQAEFDDRAFAVLEDAVDILAPDGTRETGLVLLPFAGLDPDGFSRRSGAQLFTFSRTTVTPRGFLEHGGNVLRSFSPRNDRAVTLSAAELRHWDATDPEQPAELGRLALAPRITAVFAIDDAHGVRVRDEGDQLVAGPNGAVVVEPAELQVFALDREPNSAPTLARIDVPANATVRAVGSFVVAIEDYGPGVPNDRSRVHVFDFSVPATPTLLTSTTTERIGPLQTWVLDSALVVDGRVNSPVPVGSDPNALSYAGWTRAVTVIDLAEAGQPRIARVGRAPDGLLPTTTVLDGDVIHAGWLRPEDIGPNVQPTARYYVQAIDLGDVSAPSVGPLVNVPGVVAAVDGDVVVTRDFRWRGPSIEWSVNRSRVTGSVATLLARKPIVDSEAGEVVRARSSGELLVLWRSRSEFGVAVPGLTNATSTLDVLDPTTLATRRTMTVPSLAQLYAAADGLAFVGVDGGVLVVETKGGGAVLRRFLATDVTASVAAVPFVREDLVLVPAGRYGARRLRR